LHELLQGVNKNKPVVTLDHQPVSLAEADDNGVDLQLSGHTHNDDVGNQTPTILVRLQTLWH